VTDPDTRHESEVWHITFKRELLREQHIRDAQRVDDWPDNELHEVVVDPDEITVDEPDRLLREDETSLAAFADGGGSV
jgi:hypothetical protein